MDNSNNNNNNDVQMVSIPLEDESLNQVLNIDEVEELAKIERKASRRPGLMFLFAGFLAIVLGVTFPYMMSALGDDSYLMNDDAEDIVSDGSVDEEEVVTELVCSSSKIDEVTQITYAETVTFKFNSNGLTGYVKNLNATPVDVLNENYVAEVTTYSGLVVNTPGYKLDFLNNTTSYDVNLVVDLLSYDLTTLGDDYKSLDFTNIKYFENEKADTVKQKAEIDLYKCE